VNGAFPASSGLTGAKLPHRPTGITKTSSSLVLPFSSPADLLRACGRRAGLLTDGFKSLVLKNTDLMAIAPDIAFLVIFTVVTMAAATRLFRRTL
jgi:hypothetical protein